VGVGGKKYAWKFHHHHPSCLSMLKLRSLCIDLVLLMDNFPELLMLQEEPQKAHQIPLGSGPTGKPISLVQWDAWKSKDGYSC
jgi:hypothetical protein